ncbi:MAG: SpoIIE family protein phosphatase [Bacteroidales bacterium]|nr:SpoIIE family protein phosphatase [Bacteroidales bacterium]
MSKYREFYILLMLSLLVLIAPAAYAGGDDINVLLQNLKAAKSDKDKAEAGLAVTKYYREKNDSRCVTYGLPAVKPATKAKLDLVAAELNGLVGDYYFANKYYKFAVSPLEAEYSIEKRLLKAVLRSQTCYKLGFCYSQLGNNKKAKKYYDESWSLARKLGDKELMNKLTKVLCDVSVAAKDYKSAYEYMNQYFQTETKKFKDENARLSGVNEEQSQLIVQQDSTISEITLQNEILEQSRQLLAQRLENQQLKLKNTEQELKIEAQQHQIEKDYRIKLAWGVAFVLMLLIAAVLAFVQKRRTNRELSAKNEEITRKNALIESKNMEISKNLAVISEKNRDITDSLTYAGKIQKALLRTFDEQSHMLGDYFVFYAPKDIVSGDFYWCHKLDGKFVFTVGDCTGHSVPGAFMSMLGLSLLNHIVVQQGVCKASSILEMMRSMVKSYLGQTGINEEPKDGMDMALCVWDMEAGEVDFSGAYNPLLHVRDGELWMHNAVKSPVGIHNRELPFTDEIVKVQKGDRLFMFSDGYSDQFGGERQEKFKMGRFKNLIKDTSNLPMTVQADRIRQTYYNWKGDFIQIDDVCVLGVEI